MKYSWIVIAWLGPTLEDILLHSDLCSVEVNPGFLKPMGITSERSYRPWIVKPTLEVWQEVCRRINSESEGHASGRSSQLSLQDKDSLKALFYNFNIRFYRPGTLCIEVEMGNDMGNGVEHFFIERELSSHISASLAVNTLIGMIGSGQPHNYPKTSSYSARPAMLFMAPISQEGFSSWKKDNKNLLAGLLINNRNYGLASEDLADKIFDKNKELDVKYAKSAFSMVSKQGVLTAHPENSSDLIRDIKREHKRRFRFLEYALALQKFTEKYQEVYADDKIKAQFLLFLCIPFLRESVNLPKTVTGSNTWKILSDEFSLERSLDEIELDHLEESKDQEKFYIKLIPGNYDSKEYMKYVRSITRPHRNIVLRDFSDKKIIAFAIPVMVTLVGFIIAYIYKSK